MNLTPIHPKLAEITERIIERSRPTREKYLAFMNSKTLVATDIPGLNEVVTNENGILVPVKDPIALAVAIDKLASDAILREELASRAKKDYESKFSYPLFLENYRELYRELKGEGK